MGSVMDSCPSCAKMRKALRRIVSLELSGSYLPVHMAKRMAEIARAALKESEAIAQSCPISNERIMAALVKPENTSETRWRMELRRRANPERCEWA